MKLIDNWRAELNRLWSVRIAIFMALLSAGDQVLASQQGTIPPITYGALSILFIVLRLVLQQKTANADASTAQ